MVPQGRHAAAAGRQRVRRLIVFAAVVALTAGAKADPVSAPRVNVTEADGVFTVTAAFAVSEPAHTVIAVLTDYDRIPKFMPDVQISKVVERTPAGAVVEQEAVSKFMMFSKRVHLVLDVREDGNRIRFRDRCGKSFAAYQGSWTITEHDSLTVIDYELSAQPSFEVPGFVLKRLLKRDAALLIDRLKTEITARAQSRK